MALPQQLGRYRIEAELGQGAMGRVYLGHDPAIDRKVAVKTIHLPQGLPDAEREEAEARFNREIQAAGRLSHQNIVTVYDVGRDAVAGAFVAMEYVQGRTLEEIIREGGLLEPRVIASIGCQAADALAYAHRSGIVHRDIKPANLILVEGTTVKITDFGLAKPAGSNLTSDGTLLGTPYYMSPEQVEGRPVDGRSDLFSLAVVIYELLTGKRPFRGDSISTVVYRILHEPPVEPDLGRLTAGSAVKSFLGRALAKDPDRRFPDGDSFARALREAMSSGVEVKEPATAAVTSDGGGALNAAATRGDTPPPETSRPYRPTGKERQRSGRPTGRGDEKRTAAGARRWPPASRRRRRMSGMPLVLILAVAAVVAFVYRDTLFELAQPYLPGAAGIPDEVPAAAGPEVGTAGEGPDAAGSGPRSAAPGTGASSTGAGLPPRESDPAGAPAPPAPAPAGDAQPAAAAAPPGGIRLRSEPAGASFRVDGHALQAPIVPVPEGGASVVVAATLGCRSGQQEVSAANAGEVVTILLANDIIPVSLEANPGKADVTLDGEKVGRTPLTLNLDACSEHQVKVEKAEHKAWTAELDLKDGRLQAPDKLEANLEPLPRGTLVAPAPPYEVRMAIAGRRVEPGEEISLVADTYRMLLQNDSLLYRHEERVRIRPDRKNVPEIAFPGLARFSVLAAPSNVSLEIRGEAGSMELGAPPITGQQVVAGTYTLSCRFQHNGEEQSKTVVLEPGDNPPVRFVAEKP